MSENVISFTFNVTQGQRIFTSSPLLFIRGLSHESLIVPVCIKMLLVWVAKYHNLNTHTSPPKQSVNVVTDDLPVMWLKTERKRKNKYNDDYADDQHAGN